MTDQTTVESSGTVPMSNLIDTGTTPHESGGGIKAADLAKPEVPAKPESVRDTLESVRKEQIDKVEASDKAVEKEDKTAKDETKAVKDEKPAEAKEAKAEETAPNKEKADEGAADKPAAGTGGDEGRQSEGRKHSEPPARFLPEARTRWANVPNEVKAEVHRVSQEYERELQEHRQFRDDLREYEDLARTHNVTVKETMARYVAADRALNQDFGAGVAKMAQMYGHSPVATIAAVLRAYGVTPQQYAQQVSQNPQAYSAPPPQAQPEQQAPRQDPQVSQLMQEVQDLKFQMASTSLAPVLEQFAEQNPDFNALMPQVADILRSGVIEKIFGEGLTPHQRLSEAYRMAGGTPSRSDPDAATTAPPAARPENLDAGTKSVRGAPTGGDDTTFERPAKSTRDLLREEMRKLRS